MWWSRGGTGGTGGEPRLRALLAANARTDEWAARAAKLGLGTTRGELIRSHPVIRTLYRISSGWADDARQVAIAAARPALRNVDLAGLMGFDLNTPDVYELQGPDSDFDPANSVPFAWAASESVWYSVLVLPGTPLPQWPVVECEPAGKDNIVPVALDVADFIRDWFAGAGPYTEAPCANAPEPQARALFDILAGESLIDRRAALRADAAARAGNPLEPRPRVPPESLRPLITLAVSQDE